MSSCVAQAPTNDPLLAEAQKWIGQQEYTLAMPALLQAANHGNATAMRQLGLVYGHGLGRGTADPKWGLQWFQRAAAAGDVASAFYIGDLYAKVQLGKPDIALARFWYTKSYAEHDAAGAVGLAELACSGTGQRQDLAACSRLLAEADSLHKADGADITGRLATDWGKLGGDYHVTGTRTRALAAAAYRRSADLGDDSSAIAESNLYLRPGSSSRDLSKAAAALDSFVTRYRPSPDRQSYDMPGSDAIGTQYVKIGDAFQEMGPAQAAYAVPVYASAAQLGKPQPAIRLAMRYAQGDGVGRSLSAASKQLLALKDPPPHSVAAEEYIAALQFVAKAYRADGTTAAERAAAKPLSDRVEEVRYAPGIAATSSPPPERAAPDTPIAPVQDRFPNMIAPPTVTPLQKFPVMVSLNSSQFDKNTVVLSGGQPNGEVQITMMPGITSVQIGVSLIAPAMTSVDGVYTQTIELTLNQDSTTAVFQLQAGAAAGTSPIFATLTYNGAFLAQIRRDVTVADAAASNNASTVASAPVTRSAPPLTPPAPRDTFSAPPAPPSAPPDPPISPSAPPVHLDPEARAPDMTITEIRTGDTLTYSVNAPGVGYEQTSLTGAAQRQAMVAKLYSDLEAQGNVLDQIGGKSASQQARDFAEGKGNDLYDQLAPDAFKKLYQKMKVNGTPPRTIEVLTSSSTLPWELLRPMAADGTRDDFLGNTVAIVNVNAATTPLVPPTGSAPLETVAVIAPHYDGDLSLAGAQQEVLALKTSFPEMQSIDGSVDAVSALGRALPTGIIHFAGHGLRVTTDGLPPDVALSLSDGSIIPSTWKNLAEQNRQVHPFYFFNACDLGRSDETLDYISGWASTLMQSGASGFLGALWKVSDTTATSFANHFYKDLKTRLAGHDPWSVAEVVTQARQETYMEAFDPTALAYILYADPYETMTDQE